MIRVDLHVHTIFSGDATINPKLLVDTLYAHSTVKGVAITDHDTLEGYFQVRKLATVYQDLLVIPGVEVTTSEGHFILLGIEEKPPFMSTLESVVDFAIERAALIVIPHPYRADRGIGDAAERIQADAIEVKNPSASLRENRLAEKLAKARSLPGVAGSDAHNPSQLWTAYTEVDSQPDVDGVLNAIKNGRVKAVSIRHYLNV